MVPSDRVAVDMTPSGSQPKNFTLKDFYTETSNDSILVNLDRLEVFRHSIGLFNNEPRI